MSRQSASDDKRVHNSDMRASNGAVFHKASKKEAGGPGGGSPLGGVVHPSLSKLQNILPFLPRCQEVLWKRLIENPTDCKLQLLLKQGGFGQLVSMNSSNETF